MPLSLSSKCVGRPQLPEEQSDSVERLVTGELKLPIVSVCINIMRLTSGYNLAGALRHCIDHSEVKWQGTVSVVRFRQPQAVLEKIAEFIRRSSMSNSAERATK